MILETYTKQPADALDYDIDYTDWLGDATIAGAVVTADDGITVDSHEVTGASKRVKVWLSGGTSATTYKITVTITTSSGLIKQDEFKVKVKEF